MRNSEATFTFYMLFQIQKANTVVTFYVDVLNNGSTTVIEYGKQKQREAKFHYCGTSWMQSRQKPIHKGVKASGKRFCVKLRLQLNLKLFLSLFALLLILICIVENINKNLNVGFYVLPHKHIRSNYYYLQLLNSYVVIKQPAVILAF